jgi:hypothetical protein
MQIRANLHRTARASLSTTLDTSAILKKAVQRPRKRPATKKQLLNTQQKLTESKRGSVEYFSRVNTTALDALANVTRDILIQDITNVQNDLTEEE